MALLSWLATASRTKVASWSLVPTDSAARIESLDACTPFTSTDSIRSWGSNMTPSYFPFVNAVKRAVTGTAKAFPRCALSVFSASRRASRNSFHESASTDSSRSRACATTTASCSCCTRSLTSGPASDVSAPSALRNSSFTSSKRACDVPTNVSAMVSSAWLAVPAPKAASSC